MTTREANVRSFLNRLEEASSICEIIETRKGTFAILNDGTNEFLPCEFSAKIVRGNLHVWNLTRGAVVGVTSPARGFDAEQILWTGLVEQKGGE